MARKPPSKAVAEKTPPRPSSIYSVHPSIEFVRHWVESLPKKTGRSLSEWLELVRAEGPPTEKERRAWLKDVHKLGTNSAWWIAERVDGKGQEADSPAAYLAAAAGYVETMYAGPRTGLRPIHDALIRLALDLGPDIRICPCQTIVPIYRAHVIAQIKPATNTRLDLGLALGSRAAKGRLIDTGGLAKHDRITHRIAIGRVAEIDGEVRQWLRVAYEGDL
jgi:hypothetical protein